MARFFSQNIPAVFLSPADFYMVTVTVVDDLIIFCLASTATIISIVGKACKQYHSCGTVDGDNTKTFLAYCRPYRIIVLSRRKVWHVFLVSE